MCGICYVEFYKKQIFRKHFENEYKYNDEIVCDSLIFGSCMISVEVMVMIMTLYYGRFHAIFSRSPYIMLLVKSMCSSGH